MQSWQQILLEMGESALLGSLEPNPIAFTQHHEEDVPRIRAAIGRAGQGKLARFRYPVNRNGFLLGCLDYTERRAEEHLIVGYGFRHGSTTKVESLHHVLGHPDAVAIPPSVAHSLLSHSKIHLSNEVILFHNHPINPVTLLLDILPLASRTDRLTLESRALTLEQLVRRISGYGRILFFLGQNGWVKEFQLPSLISLSERAAGRSVHSKKE